MVASLIDWPPRLTGAAKKNNPQSHFFLDEVWSTKEHGQYTPLDHMISRAKIQRYASRRAIRQILIEGKGR